MDYLFILVLAFIPFITFSAWWWGQKRIQLNLTEVQTQLLLEQQKHHLLVVQLTKAEHDLHEKENTILQLSEERARLSEQIQNLRQDLQEKLKESENLAEKLNLNFENLSNKILSLQSQKFYDQSTLGLRQILDPVKEKLKDFEKKVEESFQKEANEKSSLKGEINKLFDLNFKMSQEATNLTKALKGNSQTTGAWGELVLENILERSGLRKDEEFIVQGSGLGLKDHDGKSQRPDVIIMLPEGKHIIVDSKVPLTSFEAYVESNNADEQNKFAEQHALSLKNHIQALIDRKYHANDDLGSPDFTLLFLPLEPAFALAFKHKPELLDFAWQKGVAIVSPTTLLTTLKTVAALWRQERQNKNAYEIARTAGLLYDKFYALLGDLEKMGQKISEAKGIYQDAIDKISNGRGNLIRNVDKLKELGAKTNKSLKDKKIANELLADDELLP